MVAPVLFPRPDAKRKGLMHTFCRKKKWPSLKQGQLPSSRTIDAMHGPISAFRGNSRVRSPCEAPTRKENVKPHFLKYIISNTSSSSSYTSTISLFFNLTIKKRQITQYGQSWYVVHINPSLSNPSSPFRGSSSEMAGSLETI